MPSSKARQLGTAQESRDRGAGSSGAQPLSLSLSLFLFFSLSLSPSLPLLRAEKKPTRARGDVLLVIIGPGVGESVRERVIWASAERRGEKGGRGGERRAGQSREPGGKEGERERRRRRGLERGAVARGAAGAAERLVCAARLPWLQWPSLSQRSLS